MKINDNGIDRDMTKAEQDSHDLFAAAEAEALAKAEADKLAKAAEKAALLAKLGITDAEAKLLLA
jgi:hypothetical protein